MTHNVTPSSTKEKIKAVIFDLDGTLVSSSLNFALMREDVGCPPDQDILVFIDSLDDEAQEQARAIVRRHEAEDAESVELLPGVVRLIETLSQMNMRTGILTRNSRLATQTKLSKVGIEVDIVLTRECAPPKPDPGGLIRLCDEWQIAANEAVYVGDFLYDLLAADNANMHSCLFVSGSRPDYADKAGFVCEDYSLFLTQLDDYLQMN